MGQVKDGWYTMCHADDVVEYAVHLTTHRHTSERWVQGFGLLSETLDNYIARGFSFDLLVAISQQEIEALGTLLSLAEYDLNEGYRRDDELKLAAETARALLSRLQGGQDGE